MPERLRYLLLQVRDPEDPMRHHEVASFARVLGAGEDRIAVVDLLQRAPSRREMDAADIVLLGGSGDYSVAAGGPWLDGALDAMRDLADRAKPTFASCWGFQAMARALGGTVVTDLDRAEIGTIAVHVTEEGAGDPVFGPLAPSFLTQMGHQDIVDRLPPGAVRLARSDRVANQAFRLVGKLIYCTQFHPELTRAGLLARLRTYPGYVERIARIPFDRFVQSCAEAPDAEGILRRFIDLVVSSPPSTTASPSR